MTEKRHMVVFVFFFQYDVVVCQAAERVSKNFYSLTLGKFYKIFAKNLSLSSLKWFICS